MNIMYFTMKKLNEHRAFLWMLGFLLVFSCSKDKKEGNGNGDGNGDVTKYTLSITKPTGGKLVSKPGNIDCGSEGNDCKAEFDKGTEVTLTATADTGYILGDWQGACDKTKADQPCKLSMDANKTAGKAFLARPTLNIDPKPIYGTLTSDVGNINCGSEGGDCEAEFSKGTEVTLTAMADTGYILGAWQGNCSETGIEEETCKLSMDANKTAGRAFLARPTLSIDPKPIYGTLTSDVGNINCGSEGDDCEAEFDRVVEVTLTAAADTGYALAAWQGACDETEADQPCKLSMDANRSAGKFFIDLDVDDDDDGLMEVRDLDMFNHIQYSLAGTSYKMGADAEANIRGAPASQTDNCKTATAGVYLCGYELMGDLDFAQDSSYAGGSVNTDWQPTGGDADSAVNEGFVGATNFAGIFEGNGHSISNLYSRGRSGSHRGLFRATTSAASIRNLGVVDANIYSTSGSVGIGGLVGSNLGSIVSSYVKGGTINKDGILGDLTNVGGLVGLNQGGNIVTSHARDCTVNGGTGNGYTGGLVGSSRNGSTIIASHVRDCTIGGGRYIGGLVGGMFAGTNSLTASYVTGGTVNSGTDRSYIGGLVGSMGPIFSSSSTNSITASYATGTVNGGAESDRVGGLVGIMFNDTNSITASYATGDINGGVGVDNVGGLVGYMLSGTNTITASYATGTVNGGVGVDNVGGLVGNMGAGTNSITASYATGAANGGSGADDVGALVGEVDAGGTNTITHSYGFGDGTMENDGNDGTAHPAGLSGSGAAKANTLTDPVGSENTDADVVWDQTGSKTKGAWDFGTTSQAPALKYADYDGSGGTDYCALFPPKIPGTDTNLVCDTTPLPGQGR